MEQFDKSQRAFCETQSTNIRLLAPAGCGKTLCLLFRCKYLADQSRSQRPRFLIVTFTRAARDELLTRLNEDTIFAEIRDLIEITTLNSWGFRRIKNAAFSPKLITTKTEYHFAMLNQLQPVWQKYERVKSAIEKKRNNAPRILMDAVDAFKSLGFDHVRHSNYEQFVQHLDKLRAQNLTWKLDEQFDELTKFGVLESIVTENGKEVPRADDGEVYDVFFKFWIEATEHLISNATFTLEDQKYFAYLDERKKIEDRSFLSGAARYHHVFVDEFQDINPLDLALIKAIAERSHATVTIAGDDDQAIFEWRGATPEYILDPAQFIHSPFDTYTLEVNYRSPKNIVEQSQRLISNNWRRVEKRIRAYRTNEAWIEIKRTDGLIDSLDYVYKIVAESIEQGMSPSRVAIIGRKRSQIIPYQVYFASKEISFCAAEDLQVFLSDTFNRLLNLLMIKTRSTMQQSRSQVINDMLTLCDLVKRYPINKKDRENLRKYLQQSKPHTLISGTDTLARYRGVLKGKNTEGKVSIAMADAVRSFIDATTVSNTLIKLSRYFDGLQLDFGKAEEDIFYTDPPFLQLAEYASRYEDNYEKFVDDIEHAKDQLVYIPPFEDSDQGTTTVELWKHPLHLMTALRAKGKEFDTVILLDVLDGIWPHRNAKTPLQREAERRVFYVAFTRARKKIVMLVSHRGGTAVSPYISELGLSVD